MSVQEILHDRTYVYSGPPPKCPEHNLRMQAVGVRWVCPWVKTERREGRHGWYEFVVRCTYRPGKREPDVEALLPSENPSYHREDISP